MIYETLSKNDKLNVHGIWDTCVLALERIKKSGRKIDEQTIDSKLKAVTDIQLDEGEVLNPSILPALKNGLMNRFVYPCETVKKKYNELHKKLVSNGWHLCCSGICDNVFMGGSDYIKHDPSEPRGYKSFMLNSFSEFDMPV